MRKQILVLLGSLMGLAVFVLNTNVAAEYQGGSQSISTNKDKLLKIAVHGQIAHMVTNKIMMAVMVSIHLTQDKCWMPTVQLIFLDRYSFGIHAMISQ